MAKKLTDRVEAWRGRASIRYTMFLSFTASAIIAVFLTGITLYLRFSSQLNTAIQAENQMVMEQVEQSLSTYLRDMLGLADSCSYNVVKGRNVQNEDLTSRSGTSKRRMTMGLAPAVTFLRPSRTMD